MGKLKRQRRRRRSRRGGAVARVSARQRGMANELWRAIPVVMRDKGRRERDGYIAHHHAERLAVTNIVENVPKWWIDGAA